MSALFDMLSRPQDIDTLDTVTGALRVCEVSVRVKGYGTLAKDPGVPAKVRGAVGHRLMETASAAVKAEQDCTFTPPCAYQIFYRTNGQIRPGLQIPAPIVFALDQNGKDLTITARLFGVGADYSGEIADALIRALRTGLSGIGKLAVTDRQIAEVSPNTEILRGMVDLSFVTPLLIRNNNTGDHVEPLGILKGLVDRVDALARWGGMALDPALRADLLATIQGLEGEWAHLDVNEWKRGAQIQGKILPMKGVKGRVVFRGELSPISPLIWLGAQTHAGARCAFGQGRYVVSRHL